MKDFWAWLQRLFYSATPTNWPEVATVTRIFADTNKDLKVCAVAVTSNGILFTPYHNITRSDAWVRRLGPDGRAHTVLFSGAETYGTPDLVGDHWIFPHEQKNGRIKRVHDKTSSVSDGPAQPVQYATRCVAGVIGCNGRGENPFLWDAVKNLRLYTFDAEGIISGLAKLGDDWLAAIMDGGKPGLFSTRGWRRAGKYVEVVVLAGEIIAFEKSGAVEVISASDGKLIRTIGNTGNKAQRARVKGRFAFWTTANWDQLWVTDGQRMRLLHEWKDGDTPVNDGSLFNTSFDFEGDNLVVGRSIDRRGYELYRIHLK